MFIRQIFLYTTGKYELQISLVWQCSYNRHQLLQFAAVSSRVYAIRIHSYINHSNHILQFSSHILLLTAVAVVTRWCLWLYCLLCVKTKTTHSLYLALPHIISKWDIQTQIEFDCIKLWISYKCGCNLFICKIQRNSKKRKKIKWKQ